MRVRGPGFDVCLGDPLSGAKGTLELHLAQCSGSCVSGTERRINSRHHRKNRNNSESRMQKRGAGAIA